MRVIRRIIKVGGSRRYMNMEREACMSSAAVKCLSRGVIECVKSKTYDEPALGGDERESE